MLVPTSRLCVSLALFCCCGFLPRLLSDALFLEHLLHTPQVFRVWVAVSEMTIVDLYFYPIEALLTPF